MLVRRTTRAPLVTASLTAAFLVLAGCDSGSESDPDGGSAQSSGPAVIAPGKPGEAAQTLSPEEVQEQRAEDDTPNSADFDYVRMMIVHHTQALEMTELAPDHAKSTPVKRIAERISAAQKPEIEAMEGWLKVHDGDKRDTAHDHETMPGMATGAQLRKLGTLDGEKFDQLFLKLMITHHEGAITMATDVKAQGNNILVEEMADDVIAQQATEISRMRDLTE
ncbi:DUF305 domain-containing protein [Streptomyces europaeiscabiei]|uniref:DUF305 domain-containing protein n=1 Tax=Streptomyces TaxID=1883 RepID=UPI000A3CB174|nr:MULTISPECIES: DUF305 domain-containing protein [Streptomyces]MDX3582328.1 DUF305 domain-containing protein [Streptomyces europaeiscabiei]MDX3612711.1 DUF305 domain-containing protein [Streptomyces europaeiscabiei]MDX3630607.1 DUF305 domain-containing protein [Streptomyces europaeiscabiei]MDX3648744.1 DUF305 domain-containing protein [Streptomyces europaeiscabiei]WUD30749.1 DUF305 domain-containing protein [Streptomyces europaeiscabiei]